MEILKVLKRNTINEPYSNVNKENVILGFKKIQELFYPNFFKHTNNDKELLEEITLLFKKEFKNVLVEDNTIDSFINAFPKIKELLDSDIIAIYDGDPSVYTKTEIILAFPGFFASFCYRLGHELYELNVPVIPRILTEYAHEKTGIDIHPGAKIGHHFCIDHGTGIVIGETTVVGNHVRIYHGVTLGVKKHTKDIDGKLIKGGKRHPNIGNNVVIFSNASVLGGDTYIPDNYVVKAGSIISKSIEVLDKTK